MTLTQQETKELFDYNPDTGVFVRKKNMGRNGREKAGSVVGCLSDKGYLIARVNGKAYRLHRLAWLYVNGYLPETGIDHINKDKADNRIKNLRETSQSCNLRNIGNTKRNKSGVKGVRWSEAKKKWAVRIVVYGKPRYLGRYDSFDNAVCARLAGEQCLDWQGCDKTSPAYLYVQNKVTQNGGANG